MDNEGSFIILRDLTKGKPGMLLLKNTAIDVYAFDNTGLNLASLAFDCLSDKGYVCYVKPEEPDTRHFTAYTSMSAVKETLETFMREYGCPEVQVISPDM